VAYGIVSGWHWSPRILKSSAFSCVRSCSRSATRWTSGLEKCSGTSTSCIDETRKQEYTIGNKQLVDHEERITQLEKKVA
jgi:hypothetical protein